VDDDKEMDAKYKCRKLAQTNISKVFKNTFDVVYKEVTHRKESINQTNKV
jgi:hypothetical protein